MYYYVIFSNWESWSSSSLVVESLVNDLDCVSRNVKYPALLVFSYAVFNNEQIDNIVKTTYYYL